MRPEIKARLTRVFRRLSDLLETASANAQAGDLAWSLHSQALDRAISDLGELRRALGGGAQGEDSGSFDDSRFGRPKLF